MPPQLSAAATLLGNRRLDVDALFISAGGNDIRFSTIIKDCMWMADCHKDKTINSRLRADVDALPARYDRVAACIGRLAAPTGCELGSDGGVALSAQGKTFITEYPDATRDENGAYCDRVMIGHPTYAFVDGLYAPEFQWAALYALGQSTNTRLPGVNDKIAEAAVRHGWTYVDGLDEKFRTHGYCSTDSWIVRFTESFWEQHDKEGTFHPNVVGHTTEANIITPLVRSVTGWR